MLFTIPLLAGLNGLRGAGLVPRWLFFPIIIALSPAMALIIIPFYLMPVANSFLLVTGWDTRSYNRSDSWLAHFTDKVFHKLNGLPDYAFQALSEKQAKQWGAIYTMLRSTILMGSQSVILGVPYAVFFPLIAYWLGGKISDCPRENGVRCAEIILAALWGLLICLYPLK